MVEDLRLSSGGRWDEVLVENIKDDLSQFPLDLLPVAFDLGNLSLIPFVQLKRQFSMKHDKRH